MIEEIKLPEISENVESGEVVKVLVQKGEEIRKEQPVVEIETDKASFEVPSTAEGKVAEIMVKTGETISVGRTVITVESDGKAAEKKPEKEKPAGRQLENSGTKEEPPPEKKQRKEPEEKHEPLPEETAPEKQPLVPAAPSVRREAREMGIEISEVEGSGPGGRILPHDLKEHVSRRIRQNRPRTAPASPPLPDFSQWGETQRQPMSKVRAITADSMFTSWNTVPQVTQFDHADIGMLEKFRSDYDGEAKEHQTRLSITAVLVKIVAAALQHFPKFNTSVDMEKKEIIYKKYINIGIAVDTPRGLLVPVIRRAERKSIIEIAREAADLAHRARSKKIDPGELKGGNFTISNIGGIGGTNFTPIIYHPQVAILGAARASAQLIRRDGEIREQLILPLSLSYDHRVIDGADGARFLRWVAQALENPFRIHLD